MSATSGLTRREVLAAGAAAAVTRRAAGRRPNAPTGRRLPRQSRRSPALRSAPDRAVVHPDRALLHPQPPPQAPGRPGGRPGTFGRGRPGGVMGPDERDDLRLQAPPRRALASEGARQRPRDGRRGREVHLRPIPRVNGNPVASSWRGGQVDALDRHTVRFTLKAPNAWFLDALATTAAWIVPREAVEQHGDLKRPEACIGTGPWMLERYEPNVRLSWVRHPHYFARPAPRGRRRGRVDRRSRLAAWPGGSAGSSTSRPGSGWPSAGWTLTRSALASRACRPPSTSRWSAPSSP